MDRGNPCGQHTVLVVDDDELVLATLTDLVQREGHLAMAAPGGKQALELVGQGGVPCLALVDLLMPGMSGIELCRALRSDARTQDTTVIIVSAKIGPADVAAGEAAGASDYIKKPFDVDEARLRVRVHLRLHELALEQRRIRRVNEEALRRSEERYRQLFQSSRDAIMTLAPPDWRFTAGNRAALEMFGARDEAAFVALAPWALSPAEQPDGRGSPEKAREMIELALREGSHFFDWTHRRSSGECFAARVLLTRMAIGEEVFLQATVRDLTDPKRPDRR